MIIGNISNINNQSILPEILLKFLNYLKKTDFSKLKDGKISLGEDVTLNLFSYQTKNLEDKKAEAHRKYIDIQYVISGQELIGLGHYNSENELIEEYNEEKDSEFYRKIINEHFLIISKGMFAVFFTTDIHRPGCVFNKKSDVRKAVIKISADKIKK